MLKSLMTKLSLIAFACSLSVAAHAMADAPKAINVPAGDLVPALEALAKETAVELVFQPDQLRAYHTDGLKGNYEAKDAIRLLLKGTGLEVETDPSGAMLIAPPKAKTQSDTKARNRDGTSDGERLQLAQAAPAETQEPASVNQEEEGAKKKQEVQLEEVLVTGTHIRGALPTSPVQTITQEDIQRSGYITVGDVMRSLPQNFIGANSPQNVTGAAPGTSDYTATGGSAPNLRGIGASSTLTLINGHRMAQDMPNGAVDITSIPVDAIERIDVITDGASAIYGSDAVAGVVNVILKRGVNDALTTASLAKATEGGANEWRVSQLFGKTWDSGDLMLTYEHDKQGAVNASQRDFSATALEPFTIWPQSRRDSVALTADQTLFASVRGFLDGLYMSRDTWNAQANPFTTPYSTYINPYSVTQKNLTAGLTADVAYGWQTTLFGTVAQQQSANHNYFYSAATPVTPLNGEMFYGLVRAFEVNADGPIAQLPSGPVRLALGAGDRKESFSDGLASSPLPFAKGGRRIDYGFAELSIPLVAPSERAGLRRLDLNMSGRYEHYSDVGNSSVPKVGLAYTPVETLKLRTSWGKSFRAPTVTQLYGAEYVSLDTIPDPRSASGSSPVLDIVGGNPALKPERASSWTAGFEWAPKRLEGLTVSATYFDISYTQRLGQIPYFQAALTDPQDAAFVIPNPSLAFQNSIIALGQGGFGNYSGGPYVPSAVAAFVDARALNITRQDVNGVDALIDQKFSGSFGALDLSFNGTYLDLRQLLTPNSQEIELTGRSFYPPRFRARTGATWTAGPWSTSAFINYLDGEVNTYQPGNPNVSSWTTVDATLSYAPQLTGFLSGWRVAVSVQNLFDRDPPYVLFDSYGTQIGLHYDSFNANPLGRFVNLTVQKRW